MVSRKVKVFLIAVCSVGALVIGMILVCTMPKPSGTYPVGKRVARVIDGSRPELATARTDDVREVVLHIWYPAVRDQFSHRAEYVDNFRALRDVLVTTGALKSWQGAVLPHLRGHSWADAAASRERPWPLLLFSPGNGSNASFYTFIAEELASRGFVVVCLDHPYDVGAVQLADASVAAFASDQWPRLGPGSNRRYVEHCSTRIAERARDCIFALNELQKMSAEHDHWLNGLINFSNVAIAGHSVGGLAAAEAAKLDDRFRACVNVDGLLESFPLLTNNLPKKLSFEFLYIGKPDKKPSEQLLKQWGITREEYNERMRKPKEFLSAHLKDPTTDFSKIIQTADHASFTDSAILNPLTREKGRAIHSEFLTILREFLHNALTNSPPEKLSA